MGGGEEKPKVMCYQAENDEWPTFDEFKGAPGATIKKIQDRNDVAFFLVIYALIMSIISIQAAATAYSVFDAATGGLQSIVNSWNVEPIVGIELVANSDSCSNGYTALTFPAWPGSASSACACPSGAYYMDDSSVPVTQVSQSSSDVATCDANQTAAKCVSQPEIEEIDIDHWQGKSICIKRGELAQLNKGVERPVPTKNGVCPRGYEACGSGKTTTDRTTCVKTGEDCPLTTITFAGVDPSLTVASTNVADGFMPINKLQIAFYDETEQKKYGFCFNLETLAKGSQKEYSSSSNSYTYVNNIGSTCKKLDERWELITSVSQEDYLKQQFEDETVCTSDSVVADYLTTPYTKCTSVGDDDFFSNENCMVSGKIDVTASDYGSQLWNITGCGASDTVCKNIVYQSNCGALTRFATESQYSWAIYGQREIYWDPTCEVTTSMVEDIIPALKDAKGALLANMIINIIANVFIGVIINMLVWTNLKYGNVSCVPYDGLEEKHFLEFIKSKLSLLFAVMKIIPAMMGVVSFNSFRRVLNGAAEGDCTDDLTDPQGLTVKQFVFIDEQVSGSRDALIQQLVFDYLAVFLAVVAFIFWVKGLICPPKAEEEGEDGDKKNAEISADGTGL